MVFDDRFYAGTRVTSSGADPTHHIKLDDGERSVGFVITDQSGDRDERTFRRFPHSDPAQPYITEKQTSFGGGFGQATFEENRSKYWKSLGVDTTKDVLVLGPAMHHAKGTFVRAQENLDYATFSWQNVGAGGRKWVAIPFTPAQNWTGTTYLKLFCKRYGNPPSLRVRTYTNSGGEPNTQIHSQDFTPDEIITDPSGEWIRLTITDTYAYSASTQYWLVLTVTGSGNGEWWFGHTSYTSGLKSADGASWGAAGRDLLFRIYGNNDNMVARWIDYKQQTYALLDWDNTDDAELWMNGWRGACDSNSGNLNSLVDATDSEWGTKITGDEVVKIVAGPASAEIDDFRLVSSAVNGDITVTPDWILSQNIHDDYVVQNSDWFQQITTPSGYLSGHITDVAVANGQMFIARAGKRGMVYHQEVNLSGTYDQTTYWYVNPNVIGESVISMRDPIQGDQLWIGNNAKDLGDYKPFVFMTPPNIAYSAQGGVLNSQTLCNNWGYTATGTPYEYWESDKGTNVLVDGGYKRARIRVYTARVDTVASTGTGANYQVDDILTLVDPGSNGGATVKVTAVDGSGQPTSYEVQALGWDYTTGAKATTGGSGDGLATVNITDLVDISGLVAHIDFKDKDGNARTVDLRHMTDMKFVMKFEMLVSGNWLTLSSGDIQLNVSATAGSDPAIIQYTVPDMISGVGSDKAKYITLDLDELSGAEAVTSLGIEVTQQANSYILTLIGPTSVWRDIEPVLVGQVDGDNITGLETFGDPEQLWVFTEAGYGPIKNNRFLPVPNREIRTARHANNGRGHTVHDVYLLFTWKGRLQRYYRQNLEDLGPDFPEGMGDIAGQVVDVVTYPGRFYVAVDGGASGKSMILCHRGGGWHEVYTSFTGERIRSLFIQAIEDKSDKLWASVGADLMWFPIELQSAELPANTDYIYRPTGYLDTSWIYTSSRELDKAFRSILLTLDKAKDDDLKVDIHYQIDDPDGDWVTLDRVDEFSSSTLRYKLETFGRNAKGNRIRFRFELHSRVLTKSPKVRSIQARMYRMSEVKFSYTWLSKLSTISVNLRGDEEKVAGQFKTCQQAFDLIDAWAATLTPLKITSDIASIHNKEVIVEPIPAQLLMIVHDEQIQEQSIQMQANDA